MSYREMQLAELQSLVADLGKDGGLVSPSIYDTAQVMRLYPPKEGVEPAMQWLLAQQQADGGWGEREAPYARDVPTLAAVLALHTYPQYTGNRAAVDAGLAFLAQQAPQWAEMPIDALPIATEMILPYLIEEANQRGLPINRKPYAILYQLRERKCRYISAKPLQAGSPPTHSWEALGRRASSIAPDHSGGIGHSPAATVAWLSQAQHDDYNTNDTLTAQHYLVNAAAATGMAIPGVVPNVWPITGFELAYAPYTLLVTNLFQQPAMQATLAPLFDELGRILAQNNGVSFGECFTPDVDDTGLAVAVLRAANQPVESTTVLQFKQGDHFCTFHHELNPSIFANAHALYGLAYVGEHYPAAEQFLCNRQMADGRWLADKLHSSWLYTTLEVVITLSQLGYTEESKRAAEALLRYQHETGGWGSGSKPTRVETSYALITLLTIHRYGLLHEAGRKALQRGRQWLNNVYQPDALPDCRLWCGKELYTPYRVDRIYEICALLAVHSEEQSGVL
jgi:halimadienyl-diphosphate synthase